MLLGQMLGKLNSTASTADEDFMLPNGGADLAGFGRDMFHVSSSDVPSQAGPTASRGIHRLFLKLSESEASRRIQRLVQNFKTSQSNAQEACVLLITLSIAELKKGHYGLASLCCTQLCSTMCSNWSFLKQVKYEAGSSSAILKAIKDGFREASTLQAMQALQDVDSHTQSVFILALLIKAECERAENRLSASKQFEAAAGMINNTLCEQFRFDTRGHTTFLKSALRNASLPSVWGACYSFLLQSFRPYNKKPPTSQNQNSFSSSFLPRKPADYDPDPYSTNLLRQMTRRRSTKIRFTQLWHLTLRRKPVHDIHVLRCPRHPCNGTARYYKTIWIHVHAFSTSSLLYVYGPSHVSIFLYSYLTAAATMTRVCMLLSCKLG